MNIFDKNLGLFRSRLLHFNSVYDKNAGNMSRTIFFRNDPWYFRAAPALKFRPGSAPDHNYYVLYINCTQ